ncbi:MULTISPECIES: hypothetical protein [unclassified Variovorax]|uniref:hypothetical protein n=1 Tax=unclassified Variovorax TaxID=663243 RepID=UPI0032E73962
MAIEWLQTVQAGGRYLVDNPTIIAAAIAGIVAIVATRTTLHGVKLSLAASEAKTKAELAHSVDQENRNREHSRTEAARERELDAAKDRHGRLVAMRREVYLHAVSQMVKFQGAIGALASKDIASSDVLATITDLSLSIQRVTLVAEQETAVLARETFNVYMRIFMSAMTKVIPIGGTIAAIKTIETLRTQSLQRGETYLEAMRQFNLAQRKDFDALAAIQAQHKMTLDEVSSFGEQLQHLFQQRSSAELAYGDFVRRSLREDVSDRLDRLAVAIRTELELPSDLDVFRAQSQKTHDEVEAAMLEFKAALAAHMVPH